MTTTTPDFSQIIANEFSLTLSQVAGALALFEEGNTLPFIARYRKEATGGLDEVQLRDVRERSEYLKELEDRRGTILKSIEEQGKLDDELKSKILGAETKQALEDLYLPYKPKRRTRAMIAKERGLEPLADLLWDGDTSDANLLLEAEKYVDAEKDVADVTAALAGARDIIAERISEDAELRGFIRDLTRNKGVVSSRVISGKEEEVSKFQDYYDFSQSVLEIPSHRMLAIRRGEAEGLLMWNIVPPSEEILDELTGEFVEENLAPAQMALAIQDAYKRLIAPSVELDLRLELKNGADEEAIKIFGQNLEQLLLSSPAGEKVVIGLDPGFRTGVKFAAVSNTGSVLATDTMFLHQVERFTVSLLAYIARFKADLIAIGNGTASRETETLVRKILADQSLSEPKVVVVNEAGASVYSASDVAREEFPDLDVSLRGAISIARRLQDPLAELVKIDPKSIGVGQYQHDVNQTRLKQRLDETVESCVNRVGVEVNTASVPLLSYVAGIGPSLASNIVKLRDERGGFKSRAELNDVPRLGAKAFEQAAGFLRIRGSSNPLDSSAVHPERYKLVESIASDLNVELGGLVGNSEVVNAIQVTKYVSDEVGLPTLKDIVSELQKPGRDPRSVFELPAFRDDITEVKHLKEGMVLEGVVTNVVAFGAFVDVGVHQDGLVHISQLSDKFVADPNEVVSVGQKVKVRVVSVDIERNRIALSMQSEGVGSQPRGEKGNGQRPAGGQRQNSGQRQGGGRHASSRPNTQPKTNAIPKSGEYASNGMRFK